MLHITALSRKHTPSKAESLLAKEHAIGNLIGGIVASRDVLNLFEDAINKQNTDPEQENS